MTVVRRAASVPFSAAQMYQLVNDVETYPQFLPWCVGAELLVREPERVRARLRLKKGPLDLSFITENRLRMDRAITLSLVEGPFSRLHGEWQFEPTGNGCVVRLELEFQFRGRVLGSVLATAFKPLVDSLVEAFKARAYAVYVD